MMLITFATVIVWAALIAELGFILFSFVQAFGASGAGKWRRLGDVEGHLRRLLRRGYEGASMRFAHKPTGRVIRFEKHIRRIGDYGIDLSSSEGDWSAADIDRLRAYCAANGLTLDTRKPDEALQDSSLKIDCGQDIEAATALFRYAWLEVFGLRKFAKFKIEENDVLDLDELIDRPDYRRYSKTEYDERRQATNEKAMREFRLQELSFTLMASLLIMGIGAGTASLGLAISTLAAIGEPPDWSLTIGPVTAAGSSANWKLLLLYLLMVPGSAFLKLGSAKRNYGRSALHFFMLALPVAVVAIWIGS